MAEFFAGKDWQTFLQILPTIPFETWETVWSTVVATLLALVIGLPLGVLLVTGEPNGIRPLPKWVMALLNGLINLLRSVPFLILMIIVIPLSRLIVGTSIGTVASIVPLVIASFPFVSRLIETSIREVDPGVIEAAQSMGATPLQIITKVMVPESMPSLVANITIAATTIMGYGAMAGIIGIFKSRKIIMGAVGLAAQEMKGKGKSDTAVPRTQKDLPMKIIAIGSLLTLIAILLFFYFGVMEGNLLFTLTGVILVAVIAFLFTTVAANAIAIVGSNPVSGMTLMTLILASVIMVGVGLKGPAGMVAALIMGGVVCTALSTAGSFITDLKIGYWLGSTPKKQETFKFLGPLVSAATVAGVIMILNDTYGFTSGQLAAPQANAMAAVIEPLMSGAGAPWLLYGIGAAIAILLTLFNVSALAFALGMFIPLELNLPLLVGGLINWYVTTRSNKEQTNKERGEKGTLIASGFIAGGALMGVVSAALRFGGISFDYSAWWANPASEWLSLLMYVLLIIYMIKASRRIKK